MYWTVLNPVLVVLSVSLVVFFTWCRTIIWSFWNRLTSFPRPQDMSSEGSITCCQWKHINHCSNNLMQGSYLPYLLCIWPQKKCPLFFPVCLFVFVLWAGLPTRLPALLLHTPVCNQPSPLTWISSAHQFAAFQPPALNALPLSDRSLCCRVFVWHVSSLAPLLLVKVLWRTLLCVSLPVLTPSTLSTSGLVKFALLFHPALPDPSSLFSLDTPVDLLPQTLTLLCSSLNPATSSTAPSKPL